jgi:hypothetical protein
VLASVSSEFTVEVDHPHVDKAPSATPEQFVTAVLPESSGGYGGFNWSTQHLEFFGGV